MAGSRSASLGRNPSSDYVKRRKSLQQSYGGPQPQSPDVRSILGKEAVPKSGLRAAGRRQCAALPWADILSTLLTTLAVISTAALLLVVFAIAFHSSFAYTHWVEVRDGTVYYVQEINAVQTALLVATFLGTVLVVLAAYALLVFISRSLEARRARRQSAGLDDITDLEQGDAQLKTKQIISKLMSDAEKQYVAEYIRKSAPAGEGRKQQQGGVPGQAVLAGDKITVQKLDAAPQEQQGFLPPRSWSLKRMLTIGRSDISKGREPGALQERTPSFDWSKPQPAEVAAQLSSPDAFNRASSSHVSPASEDPGRRSENGRQEAELMRPSTPTMGERRDPFEGGSASDESAAKPRILVTKPIEVHGDGSAASDSEEEEFDRERQHSIVPHPATEQPFSAQILTRFPQQGLEGSEPSTSAGWQDVGLESDDEGSGRGRSGHMVASSAGLFDTRSSGEVKAAERLTIMPSGAHSGPESEVRGLLSVELEEVLPRPQAGLLNRLLRLARVERVNLPSQEQPAFVIQPGKEYMLGLKLRQPSTGQPRLCARWVRIQLPDGQPVRFNVEESSSKPSEWVGSACWDTCLHSSEQLAWAAPKEGQAASIATSITVGLEDLSAPGHKAEAHGVLHIIPQAWLQHIRSQSGEEGTSKASSAASFCLL